MCGSIRIFVAGIITFCIYMLISPFVGIWLGKEYILSPMVVVLISLHFFMMITRDVNDQFINGFGLFYDIWAPITESILFLVFAILLGARYGLIGVLFGPIISMLIIIFLWKPYFLFTKGFKKNILFYIYHSSKNLALSCLSMLLSTLLINNLNNILTNNNPWIKWILQALLVTSIITIISSIFYFSLSPDFRKFCHRFLNRT